MLRDVVTAPRGATLSDAERLMRSARLRHLVIVENGVVVGLVSHRELLDASLARLREGLGAGAADALGTLTIEPLVRTEITIPPESSLEAAATRMLALRLGCLPVTTHSPRGPRLVGLVTEANLLRVAYLPPPPRG
ncbi:MAG TPA: CBS domain-containing protein [Myxococcota bacterium]|nr:CBS domain-containing protein [Myxococcota bacterium]